MFENFLIWEEDMAAAGVDACGMFSPTHLIVTLVCLCVLGVALYFSRNLREETLNRIVLYIAIPVTMLECCKILFNWIHGGMTPNHWLPLTFCSFAIYSYWLIACGKGRLHEMGKGFICGGGIIGGLTFLLFPMTSVATYPMLHFLSLYSMAYHTLMMYVGIAFTVRGFYRFNLTGYKQYLAFTVPACGLALTTNLVYSIFDDIANCNMMFLSHPYRLGDIIPFIRAVYDAAPFVYSVGALAVYLVIPYLVPFAVAILVEKLRSGKREAAEKKEELV